MRQLLLIGTLAAFCLAALWGCRSRNDEPVTVPQRFFDRTKQMSPKPQDQKP